MPNDLVLMSSKIEKDTIRQTVVDLLKDQPMTTFDLVGTVFSEPYSFYRGFELMSVLKVISEIFHELHDDGIISPVFYPNEENITVLVKWTVK